MRHGLKRLGSLFRACRTTVRLGWRFHNRCRPSDVLLMRRIFAFQAHGDIPSAIRSAAALDDPLLLGRRWRTGIWDVTIV